MGIDLTSDLDSYHCRSNRPFDDSKDNHQQHRLQHRLSLLCADPWVAAVREGAKRNRGH